MATIPVILAADNNYAPYMSVLMISILKNAKSKPYFDFYLLVPNDFADEYKNKIEKDCKFYTDKQINFVNMQNSFSQTKKMISHITEQTYYRLRAAEILPDKYDKCVYLDIDTIVNGDLSELQNIDLEDNYVAGVKAPGYHFQSDGNIKYCEKIAIPAIDQYINAGVIVLNLQKIRENNLTPILCKEALKNYPTVDQDVINKIFYNHIKHLPFKYNVMTKYKSILDNTLPEYTKLCDLFSEDIVTEAITKPMIIHYADKIKPWKDKHCIFANYWWEYAKKSNFYNSILKNYFIYNTKEYSSIMLKNLCNYEKDDKHRIYKILGVKIKLKRKKSRFEKIEKLIQNKEAIFDAKIKRITPRPYLDSIGFHLVDHCNLNCKCCDVCSPIAEERFVTLESFTNDIKRLAELTNGNLKQISLSGGEALLNPYILEMMKIAREYFPASIIRLQSNGILLQNKNDEFWNYLKKLDILVTCTKYPIKVDYDKIKDTAFQHGVKFTFFNNANVIKTSYHIPFDVKGLQDPRENFINCSHANQCIGIHDGKIFTCSPAANAHHFNKYFKENMIIDERNYIDIYKANSYDEILEFLSKPIPFCKYCNVKGRTFGHEWGISKKQIEEWT